MHAIGFSLEVDLFDKVSFWPYFTSMGQGYVITDQLFIINPILSLVSKTPSHSSMGSGGANLRSPVGALANGIPNHAR